MCVALRYVETRSRYNIENHHATLMCFLFKHMYQIETFQEVSRVFLFLWLVVEGRKDKRR